MRTRHEHCQALHKQRTLCSGLVPLDSIFNLLWVFSHTRVLATLTLNPVNFIVQKVNLVASELPSRAWEDRNGSVCKVRQSKCGKLSSTLRTMFLKRKLVSPSIL